MIYVTAYLSTLVVFVFVDMAWLGTMASRFYRPTLGDIMLATVNLPAGIAFYLIYPVGLVYFAILPALKSGSLAQAMLGRRVVRLLHLYHLRPDQPGDPAELDHAAHPRRCGLGNAARRHRGGGGYWVTVKLAV